MVNVVQRSEWLYKPVDCREMTVCAEQVIVVGKEKCLLLVASVAFY